MIDLLLMVALGFLGSFGHCVSMCGSLVVALSIAGKTPEPRRQWWFHVVMNLSRIISYACGGAILGGISAALIAGGQLVGIGSQLRSSMAIIGGILLIGSGFSQIFPGEWPLKVGRTCQKSIEQTTKQPWLLGILWGLMPCGFLYTAQLKAIESGSVIAGALIMLAFGLGTAPVMLGMGISASHFSLHRRSQLRLAGGWIAILVGIITLGRSGDTMQDGTGYGAIICLILALVARPLSKLWSGLLSYRRLLGVSGLLLSIVHILHVVVHNWEGNWAAWMYLLPSQQAGVGAGLIATLLLLPAAITSFDRAQSYLGQNWRKLHLLGIPALMLATTHGILTGASYLGTVQVTDERWWKSIGALLVMILVLLVRWRWLWLVLSIEKFYASPTTKSDPKS
jgi:uncharacterized protein